MGHFTSADVTAVAVPETHVGLNYKLAQFTLTETASGSTTFDMAVLPGGSRVTDALLTFDNDALGIVAAPGTSVTQIVTGGNVHATLIQSASLNAVVQQYNPLNDAVGYRCSSSSHVRVTFTNLPASGTTTTIMSLAITYDCQEDGD